MQLPSRVCYSYSCHGHSKFHSFYIVEGRESNTDRHSARERAILGFKDWRNSSLMQLWGLDAEKIDVKTKTFFDLIEFKLKVLFNA